MRLSNANLNARIGQTNAPVDRAAEQDTGRLLIAPPTRAAQVFVRAIGGAVCRPVSRSLAALIRRADQIQCLADLIAHGYSIGRQKHLIILCPHLHRYAEMPEIIATPDRRALLQGSGQGRLFFRRKTGRRGSRNLGAELFVLCAKLLELRHLAR